jgi:hypothetical protein
MKTMTKRDVADIALVLVAFNFLLVFLTQLVMAGAFLFVQQESSSNFTNRAMGAMPQLLYAIVLLVLVWIIFFKRKYIINLLFPDSDEKQLKLTTGVSIITDYSFWIKLLGLWVSLSSVVQFISRSVAVILLRQPRTFGEWSGQYLVATILAILLIWKSKQIAAWIEKIGSFNRQRQLTNDQHGEPPSADL